MGRTAQRLRQTMAWDATVSRDARLWRVNCEALVIASGQNLKRLLQQRGWGRRPFPTEAMAMLPPPNEEPKPSSRHYRLTRPGVAVASLVAWWAFRVFFESQIRWFSIIVPIFLTFLLVY